MQRGKNQIQRKPGSHHFIKICKQKAKGVSWSEMEAIAADRDAAES